jgi:hypothetical protein
MEVYDDDTIIFFPENFANYMTDGFSYGSEVSGLFDLTQRRINLAVTAVRFLHCR